MLVTIYTPGVDLEGTPCAPLKFEETGVHPLTFAGIKHLTVCRHPGTATLIFIKTALAPPVTREGTGPFEI